MVTGLRELQRVEQKVFVALLRLALDGEAARFLIPALSMLNASSVLASPT
jgi:hypothetical protein